MRHSVELIKLKNGAQGLLINVPAATVMSTRIQFRAGLRYAKRPELYEIAHVMEHLSFGANAGYHDEQAFEADFTRNGAYHNAWTSDFSVCYETECADFEWERILKLQEIALTTPRFNSRELASEKGTVKNELTGYLNDYSRLIWPRLQTAIGEPTPDLKTRLSTLNNIEVRHIRAHYRRTHTLRNLRFIIAGRLPWYRRRQIIKRLEQWPLRAGARLPIPTDDLHAADAVLIRRKDASNLTFGFSFITPRRLDELSTFAMGCLNHLLTGTMNSRIFGQARKLGLTYGLGSYLSNSVHNASWDFDGEVNLESAPALFDLIHAELAKLLNGELDGDDLEAAKSYALGRYQMSAQTVSGIVNYYTDDFFMNDEIAHFDSTPEILKAIKKEDLIALTREFVDSNISAFVAVGSGEKAFVDDLALKLKF